VYRYHDRAGWSDKIKTTGKWFLDTFVNPLLIIVNCLIGFIFEFLVELPFLVILGFHHLFGKNRPTE